MCVFARHSRHLSEPPAVAVLLTRKRCLGLLVSGEWDEFLQNLRASRGRPCLSLKALFPPPPPKPWLPPLGFVLAWLSLQALI